MPRDASLPRVSEGVPRRGVHFWKEKSYWTSELTPSVASFADSPLMAKIRLSKCMANMAVVGIAELIAAPSPKMGDRSETSDMAAVFLISDYHPTEEVKDPFARGRIDAVSDGIEVSVDSLA